MKQETNPQMDRNEYMKERQLLIGLEVESSKSFDKALLLFSSGAIVLSVTFLEKFNTDIFFCLLVASWVLWLLSILAQLLSYFVGAQAMRRELAILNEQYKNQTESKLNELAGWPTTLNIVALITFLIGAVTFLGFITLNFNK